MKQWHNPKISHLELILWFTSKIQLLHPGNVGCSYYTGWPKSLCAPDDYLLHAAESFL